MTAIPVTYDERIDYLHDAEGEDDTDSSAPDAPGCFPVPPTAEDDRAALKRARGDPWPGEGPCSRGQWLELLEAGGRLSAAYLDPTTYAEDLEAF